MAQNTFTLFILVLLVLTTSCTLFTSENTEKSTLFERLSSSKTNISFRNELTSTKDLNTYTYRNFYNGGGVAIGDINNDSLSDIFFTGNQVSNRLYLNKGDFRFEDITNKAGVASLGVWSTGVSLADVNGDGWLDIYVCKSGSPGGDNRSNALFINNGDLTFTEKAAEYGLAVEGLSVHASFFDYDLDGDLDMYLVSNPIRSFSNAEMIEGSKREIPDPMGGNRLFRNDLPTPLSSPLEGGTRGVGGFTDVTRQAGIYSSKIGFGLGVSTGDLNRDGWPDLYISNDFFERDYLYLNNRDGTFEEVLEGSTNSISLSSMGGDIADINYDGYPEIFISDMLGGDEKRLKKNTKYNTWKEYRELVEKGYHHQVTRNTLQLNHGPIPPLREEYNKGGSSIYFSEIGRLAGVEGTDWSWGALIADFNLDGQRDIFVANGIYKDLLDQDYLDKMSDPRAVRSVLEKPRGILKLIDMIPSTPVPNVLFAGQGELRFQDRGEEWGLGTPGFSNGSAYGDLDNDGDLDLVVNNVNMEAFVYRNHSANRSRQGAGWLQLVLKGRSPNTFAVGAQATAWAGGRRWYVEQQPVRGFQSTVGTVLQLGLGAVQQVDSLLVRWPDGTLTRQAPVAINQRLVLHQPEASTRINRNKPVSNASKDSSPSDRSLKSPLEGGKGDDKIPNSDAITFANPDRNFLPILQEVSDKAIGLDWHHTENTYNDFGRQPLLFHMRSREGPPACGGDANGDGQTDLYLGGAKDQPGALFIQTADGKFRRSSQPALEADRLSEDTACTWLDANADGTLDLYVGSGGSEFPASSSALADRLYLNDGSGRLTRSGTPLIPAFQGYRPTGAVAAADYDGDGDTDLFVGDRLRPFAYGIPVDGHLLVNDGTGRFKPADVPSLKELGMITDAVWADHDADGDPDLWIAGEWMPISVLENRNGKLVDATEKAGLDSTQGWWQSLALADLDGDGDLDFVGGNYGWNSVFRASPSQPVELWAGDLDHNGTIEQVLATYTEGHPYPVALRNDLLNQLPELSSKYPDFASYAEQTVTDIFTPDQLEAAVHRQARELASVAGWNQGNGRFRIEPLPLLAQLAPIYGLGAADLDSDGVTDLLAGGNLHAVKPQVGRYDASHGIVLKGSSHERLQVMPAVQSGFFVRGEIRDIELMNINDEHYILITKNGDKPVIFKLQKNTAQK